MTDIKSAIAEERTYVADRMNGIDTNLHARLARYGYSDLQTYFKEKTEYLFNEWKPVVYRINTELFAETLEDAIIKGKYGIYIPVADGLYAYHGTDTIDYELCKELSVEVIELNYSGGTIIGSAKDFSIEIVMPTDFGITASSIVEKFAEIIRQHITGVSISGNDLLINGEKVMGSMSRSVGASFVWAAQVSFGEYSETITKVCNKKGFKKPSFIDSTKLTRDDLESEVLAWLQKQ